MHKTLISSAQLIAQRSPDWVLLDCRFNLDEPNYGEGAYRKGHIPGAHYLHLDYHLSGVKTGHNGRHPLPDPQRFAVDLGALGIGPNTQVLTYDDNGALYAARAWWLLRWMGHEAVALLDGGLSHYLKQGGHLEADLVQRNPCRFVMRAARAATVDLEEIADNLVHPHLVVVDARSPERFCGFGETVDAVGGHIPGALNRFYRDNLSPDGCFKAADTLRHEWQTLLGPSCQPENVVHQCGSGISACVNLLAMEHAALLGSRLYPGSWSEWCVDSSRPRS